MRRQVKIVLLLTLVFNFYGQSQIAIIKGKVVDSNSSEVISGVNIEIHGSSYKTQTAENGCFSISSNDLPQGEQLVVINKFGYRIQRLRVTIQNGKTINLDPILLDMDFNALASDRGIIDLSDSELADNEGDSYTISGLLQSSKDIFSKAASFDFSTTFFRPRGMSNSNSVLLINGIKMNKIYNGRPQWGNWGGLNGAQRNREFSVGLNPSEYDFGSIGGTTNIIMRASAFRKGGGLSLAISNRTYQGRIMASYNSGLNLKGWAYSIHIGRRFAVEGYKEGTLYDANSFFLSIEKKINDNHNLNLTGIYTPNRRGGSTAITREVKELKGIRYNPHWGFQNGLVRTSKIREIREPIIMMNHFWKLGPSSTLNTNIGGQFGSIGTTRVDNGGTQLISFNGSETYIGGALNPYGNYYQRLPSYFLRFKNPTPYNYYLAYVAEQEFKQNGQLNWDSLYGANLTLKNNGGNSVYVIQEDRIDDTQFFINTIINSKISENFTLNGKVSYRNLKSHNYALLKDLLGGTGYLDVDYFAEGETNEVITNVAQSDLRNRNRIVVEGDHYKYNYILKASILSGFIQTSCTYRKADMYIGISIGHTNYQRIGLFENGNFPGMLSFGNSKNLRFINYGIKGGVQYKVDGRHFLEINLGYVTEAPNLQNSFSNPRQNHEVVKGLKTQKTQLFDLNYIFRSPIFKSKVTGYYNSSTDQSDINFYYTESARGKENGNAFLQEILTEIDSHRYGVEIGAEAQLTSSLKLKGAASIGTNVYIDNPKQYFTSDDFLDEENVLGITDGILEFGDGYSRIKNYHVAGGPEQAYQLGIEFRAPDYWWVGVTANYFSKSYIDISTLRRSDAFSADYAGNPFNDYDVNIAKSLLRQEQFDDYKLVNAVGGKSWKLGHYYVGFFATINNIFGVEYITGGFENSRFADYRRLVEESRRETPVFGSRYFFGNGTTYYLNLYIRF